MNTRGFTIIEMTVALVILTLGILGFGASAGHMIRVSSDAGVRGEALQAVEGRISQMVMDPRYNDLETLYQGTIADLPGLAGSTMKTAITHTRTFSAGRYTDYKTVTVSISGPGLTVPPSRTVIVGAP